MRAQHGRSARSQNGPALAAAPARRGRLDAQGSTQAPHHGWMVEAEAGPGRARHAAAGCWRGRARSACTGLPAFRRSALGCACRGPCQRWQLAGQVTAAASWWCPAQARRLCAPCGYSALRHPVPWPSSPAPERRPLSACRTAGLPNRASCRARTDGAASTGRAARLGRGRRRGSGGGRLLLRLLRRLEQGLGSHGRRAGRQRLQRRVLARGRAGWGGLPGGVPVGAPPVPAHPLPQGLDVLPHLQSSAPLGPGLQ